MSVKLSNDVPSTCSHTRCTCTGYCYCTALLIFQVLTNRAVRTNQLAIRQHAFKVPCHPSASGSTLVTFRATFVHSIHRSHQIMMHHSTYYGTVLYRAVHGLWVEEVVVVLGGHGIKIVWITALITSRVTTCRME